MSIFLNNKTLMGEGTLVPNFSHSRTPTLNEPTQPTYY